MSDAIAIIPLPSPLPDDMRRQIDRIFFTSSLRQTFANQVERADFHERWLGRYLGHEAEHACLAINGGQKVVGYLVGALDDPALDPRYADVDYYTALDDLTPAYPAHLHINVLAEWRSHGVGARLIEQFCAHAAARAAPGVHLVTGAMSRNRRFYARHGFSLIRELAWNGTGIVMLGRALAEPA